MNRDGCHKPTLGWAGRGWSMLLAVYSPQILAADSAITSATPLLSLLKVLFGLGLVLLAIAGSAWLMRRMGPGQVAAAGALRVVGGVAIGPKERVVLVDVGDVRLVLGVAPGHVSTLHQMPRPTEESLTPLMEPMAGQFQQKLRALLNRNQDAA